MTYDELCARLTQAGIENAEWDAAMLISRFCNVDSFSIAVDRSRTFSGEELEEATRRREAREPLQYLLGEWMFYRQTYEVNPHCLIPRSDTEILVEEAIRLLPLRAHFADYCTGSGCIAVSTLAERPDTCAVAIEKFEQTLSLACRNAARNGVHARFEAQCADILAADFVPCGAPFDAILSNPPYITKKAMQTLAPELSAEPHAALYGGEDGLTFYRHILRTQTKYLKKDGFFLFEIGYDQAEAVCSLGKEVGFGDCRVRKDYGGNDRVVTLRRTQA